MDPLTNLYLRLNRQTRSTAEAPSQTPHPEPPRLEDWLRYWDDDDTDLGNLRNYEHWLTRALASHPANR